MTLRVNVKKRIISMMLVVLITISVVFMDTQKVHAVVGVDDILLATITTLVGLVASVETSDDYQDFYDNKWRPAWREAIRQGLGVIGGKPINATYFDTKFSHLGPDPLAEIRRIIEQKTGTPEQNITDDQCKQFVYNMFDNSVVNTDNDTFTVSGDLNLVLKHFNDLLDADSPFTYAYTFDINLYQFQFDNGIAYRDLLSRGTNREFISVKNTGLSYFRTPQVYNLGFVKASVNSASNWIQVYPFNLSTWEPYDFEWDRYEFVDNTYIKTGENVSDPSLYLTIDETVAGSNMDYGLFSNGSIAYPVYDSFEDLRLDNDGVQDYYINDTVYNDWSTSSGDYTVSTSNYNPVTYGDITNYVNSFNSEYGYNPNPSDIDYFIKNYDPTLTPTPTPTPNPNNPSGGGSFVNNNNPIFNNNPNINITLFPSVSDNGLNGGTVSGNGGNGSIGNIFDWIANLGNVIANLIKNVGEMIVNALQGVVEAVTTILSGIPNILTPIIDFVFGGLPEEVQALITLGITCIIFVGIIKVIKR